MHDSKDNLVHNRCMQIPEIIFFGYLNSNGLILLLGQHRFENDACYVIKQWMRVPLAIKKVRKIEVQSTSKLKSY